MIFDDSNSPEYQKFKVDKLPTIIRFEKVDYILLLAYYKHKYNKTVKPAQRRNGKSIPKKTKCPKCGAPHEYIYDNNGSKGQFQCKVCGLTFKETNYTTKPIVFICPYCGATLTEQKQRKHFKIHKCNNSKCLYYQRNLKNLPKNIDPCDKYKYKLHYIYREFNINFLKLNPISKHATGFSFKKFSPHIMGLCLTYHVNCKMSILGYQVSDTRATDPCILTMRMAFDKFKDFSGKALNFVADGYSSYPLAKQQFELEKNKEFNLTQVIGLTNDDPVSEEFRWVKQVVERLNRTFKSSYRGTCGYGSDEGALYGFSLWVAYYNFLRPHPYNYWRPLNELKQLDGIDNMSAKWQILISLGQQTILHMQESQTS
uniref:transposase n=2 Tax=Clostridium chauvoei TaxID=46867 RepID=UPI002181ECE8